MISPPLPRRPAIFRAPEFVFRLIFGQERAGIVCDSQVAPILHTVPKGNTTTLISLPTVPKRKATTYCT